MSRISGDSGRADLINTPGANIVNIEEIVPGSFYACLYDRECYFGIVNLISHENADVNFKFMHPNGPSVHFFWPARDDICWIPVQDIICKTEPPLTSGTGRFYWFKSDGILLVEQLFKKF